MFGSSSVTPRTRSSTGSATGVGSVPTPTSPFAGTIGRGIIPCEGAKRRPLKTSWRDRSSASGRTSTSRIGLNFDDEPSPGVLRSYIIPSHTSCSCLGDANWLEIARPPTGWPSSQRSMGTDARRIHSSSFLCTRSRCRQMHIMILLSLDLRRLARIYHVPHVPISCAGVERSLALAGL